MSNIRETVENLPSIFEKIIVHQLNNDFRTATKIVKVEMKSILQNLKPNEVLVQYSYLGINASDINFTAGRYDPSLIPPFDCGFEAIGNVVATGTKTKFKLRQAVGVMNYGTFAEYQVVKEKLLIPLPSLRREFLPLIVSGMTSYLALKHHGQMRSGETVLVTAAAGGAGQIAVQLAKMAGNHVIGTCSTGKEEFLKSIGCDRVINYKTEDVKKVLKKEYPRGVDIVFESVGGELFKTCFNALALKGRLIVIGSISNYSLKVNEGEKMNKFNNWETINTNTLLAKSTTITGFFLNHYHQEFPKAMQELTRMTISGKLKPAIQEGFVGLNSVYDAIDSMHVGKNLGKVIVNLPTCYSKL